MNGKRQKNQISLALEPTGRGETPVSGDEGSEPLVAKPTPESPACAEQLMEEVCDQRNLERAWKRVRQNKGGPGVDGMTIDDAKDHLHEHWPTIRSHLLEGTYQPQPVKRVEIPKPEGGVRKLGVPCVVDRLIQQALLQILQEQWDPTFSEHSYGFRPGRSAHQAVAQAQRYIAEGYNIVVDLDLEKFFDRVNHDGLMARVAARVTDKRVLKLIRAFLKAGVMEGGLARPADQGIQIDGIHMDEEMTLVAAIGVDVNGDKHPLGLVEGATENAATVQALIDNLVERGLDPAVPRLFIIDGSKALSKAIRATFGRDAAIQRCQIHKARNIMDRLPKSMHAQVRRVLRQAWEMDDADKAEKLLRNLARRLERDWEGVAASILEGLDEMLTVTKLGLPPELRRSLACTNIIENVMGTVRRVSRNVKYWRSPSMALRWAGAAMQEAAKGFRRLKAYKQLPLLQAALAVRKARATSSNAHLAQTTKAA